MFNSKLYTLVLLLIFVLSAEGVFAQLNITTDTVSDNILLSKEHSFYGLLHSNGWGFGLKEKAVAEALTSLPDFNRLIRPS